MKKLLLPFALLFLLGTACNNAAKKTDAKDSTEVKNETVNPTYNRSLIGKWKPVVAALKDMSEEDRKELLENATIEFTSDGKFISTMKDKTNTGTYVLVEQEGKLVTKQPEGKEENFTVSWNKELLILTNDEGEVTMKRM